MCGNNYIFHHEETSWSKQIRSKNYPKPLMLRATKLDLMPSIFIFAIISGLLIFKAGWLFVLILVFGILLALPFAIRFLKKSFDIFEVAVWVFIFYGWCYFLRPLYMIITGSGHIYLNLEKSHLESLLISAISYAILGIIAFCVGYRLRFSDHLVKQLPIPTPVWDKKTSYIIILLYTLIGAVASIFYLNANGGLQFYVTHIHWFRNESLNIRLAFLQWGFRLFPIASYLWLLTFFDSKHRSPYSKLLLGLYLLGSTFMLMIIGGRYEVGSYWLMIFLLYHYRKRRLHVLKMLAVLSLILIFVVIMGQIRGQMLSTPNLFYYKSFSGIEMESFSIKAVIDKFLSSQNSDAMDVFLGILLYVPDRFPFQYGKQFVDLFKALVPAGLLHVAGAREAFRVSLLGEQIRDSFWPWSGGGTPPSILGFLYLNFNFFGIIIGMLIFGLFSKLMYSYFLYNRQNKAVLLLYGLTIFSFITVMVRVGDLVIGAQGYLMKLLFAAIAISMITHFKFKRRHRL